MTIVSKLLHQIYNTIDVIIIIRYTRRVLPKEKNGNGETAQFKCQQEKKREKNRVQKKNELEKCVHRLK